MRSKTGKRLGWDLDAIEEIPAYGRFGLIGSSLWHTAQQVRTAIATPPVSLAHGELRIAPCPAGESDGFK